MDRSSWIQDNVNCSNEWSKSELQRKIVRKEGRFSLKIKIGFEFFWLPCVTRSHQILDLNSLNRFFGGVEQSRINLDPQPTTDTSQSAQPLSSNRNKNI
jgi:hypothetical protein